MDPVSGPDINPDLNKAGVDAFWARRLLRYEGNDRNLTRIPIPILTGGPGGVDLRTHETA